MPPTITELRLTSECVPATVPQLLLALAVLPSVKALVVTCRTVAPHNGGSAVAGPCQWQVTALEAAAMLRRGVGVSFPTGLGAEVRAQLALPVGRRKVWMTCLRDSPGASIL